MSVLGFSAPGEIFFKQGNLGGDLSFKTKKPLNSTPIFHISWSTVWGIYLIENESS